MSSVNPSVMELSGRLGWKPQDSRLSGSARARILLFGGTRKEWGLGGSINYRPHGNGEGLDFEVRPSIGRISQRFSSNDAFLSVLDDTTDLAFNGTSRYSPQLGIQLGYGLRTGTGLLTPYTDVFLSETSNAYSTGLRYKFDTGLSLQLEGTHKTRSSGNNDNSLSLRFHSPF